MIDRQSPTWLHIEQETAKTIEQLKNQLTQSGMPHEQAQFLRGEISGLKAVLKYGQKKGIPFKPHTAP